jgi:hypothetical protein
MRPPLLEHAGSRAHSAFEPRWARSEAPGHRTEVARNQAAE